MRGIKINAPWIASPWKDGVFVLSPPFVTLFVIFLFKDYFSHTTEVNTIAWIMLVLLVDVAHVYSTLFRTYLNTELFEKNKTLFLYTPLLVWVGGIVLYSMGPLVFWRCIAYTAVFHFVRQQYGFMKIYSRKEIVSVFSKKIDILTIYTATVYPILYWHLSGPRNFDWFVRFDFFYLTSSYFATLLTVFYFLILTIYVAKEIYFIILLRTFNPARNLVLLGTVLSWYFGIVYFNSDLIFTALNVLSHGIPYMALVWFYESKKNSENENNFSFLFKKYGWIFFLLLLFLFAFLEEGLWDSLVWNEHANLFSTFRFLPLFNDKTALTFLVPTLSLPQITHYILDGYIWRISKNDIVIA